MFSLFSHSDFTRWLVSPKQLDGVKKFNLLGKFSFVSLSGFLIAIYLLSAFYRHQAERNLIISTEENNVATAQVLSNTLWPKYGRFISSIKALSTDALLTDQTVQKISQEMASQVSGSSIVKVKTFDIRGRTILSTDDSQIGQDKSQSSGFLSAKSGQPKSQLGHRDKFQALDSLLTDLHLLSSYIPIYDDQDEESVVGVLEIYTDVTPIIARIRKTQRSIAIGSALIMLTLYGILFLFVRRADHLLSLQYQQVQDSKDRYRLQANELEETLAQLRRTQSQMVQSEKMSSLGQMVAGIAHEINNPVSFIAGNVGPAKQYAHDLLAILDGYRAELSQPSVALQQMVDDLDLEFVAEDFSRLLESMHNGSKRIRDIVSALRTFSRLDESERKAVDLNLGAESTLMIVQHRLKAQATRPEIEVIKHYADLPLLMCNAGAINQVFLNILLNAIAALDNYYEQKTHGAEFSAERMIAESEMMVEDDSAQPSLSQLPSVQWSPKITITTELSQCAKSGTKEAVITLADNGPGIHPNIKAKIFDPFFTTKPVGDGTGLGLSITHSIVTDQHDGTLECRSTFGEGTQFVIRLPYADQSKTPAQQMPAQQMPAQQMPAS